MKPSYPLAATDGKLVLTDSYPQKVHEAILSSLLTVRGERVYRPTNYGLAAEPLSALTVPDVLAECREAIAYGLEGYEGVTFKLQGGLGLEEGTVEVTVLYSVADMPGQLTVTL